MRRYLLVKLVQLINGKRNVNIVKMSVSNWICVRACIGTREVCSRIAALLQRIEKRQPQIVYVVCLGTCLLYTSRCV